MKATSVKSATVFSAAGRMDAPFYLNDAVAYYAGLEKCPYGLTTVGESSKDVFFGNIFSRCFVKDADHGVPYLRASEIQKADLNGGGLFLSKKQASQLDYLRLKRDWILVTCSGTLGKCVYADARYEQFIGTHDLIRIVPGGGNVLPGVLYSFLASRFGFATLTHSQYGSVILHTNPEQVRSIKLPVFPKALQRKVHEKIMESARWREEADAALKKAVRLFERESRQKGLASKSRTGIVTIGRVLATSRRFDARYQIGTTLLDAEKANNDFEQKPIASIARKIYIPDRGRRVYSRRGVPFISSSDVLYANPIRSARTLSNNTLGLDILTAHFNDILVSRSGTIGNVAIVGHNLNGVAISDDSLRIVVDTEKISPEYVFCYLKTKHARSYLDSIAYGSVIIHVNEAFVGAMTMPMFKGKVYDSIVEDIGEYKEKLATAADFENEAIDMVEREIESWQEG